MKLSKLSMTRKGMPPASPDWIWLASEEPRSDRYALFRGTFTVGRTPPRDAILHLSADTDYVAWLNGREVGRGQFPDFADEKTFAKFRCDGLLRPGHNVLAVQVHHMGEEFSNYQAGPPGWIAWISGGSGMLAVSGAHWRGIPDPAFRQGRAERMTAQCGFTFEYDARRALDWQAVSFDDSQWPHASLQQAGKTGKIWRTLTPRPLPSLAHAELAGVSVVGQGELVGGHTAESPAGQMAGRALRARFPSQVFEIPTGGEEIYAGAPCDPASKLGAGGGLRLHPAVPNVEGVYLLLDLGRETVGLLEFEVEANAGATMEIAHGEHLDDGRVRMRIENRSFADRYVCCAGRQSFQMPFRRLGARFLEIHVSGFEGGFTFHSIGLRPVEYPVKKRLPLRLDDPVRKRIYETAVRTLELCRHDHYEDSPWREQSLYAYDARLQALYGYFAFGDFRFPEVSLGLLGKGLRADGWLPLCAPSRISLTIPIFSFTWIAAVREHWQHSGSPKLFNRHGKTITHILESATALHDPATGLFHPPDGEDYWHFYEWTPGLCGRLGGDHLHGAHHAGFNLHLLEALMAQEWMLRKSGRKGEAARLALTASGLRAAVHRNFWDPGTGMYCSERSRHGKLSGSHELTQALALALGVVPPGLRSGLRRTMRSKPLPPCTLSASYYLVLAMGGRSADTASRRWLDTRLHGMWENMLERGATSLWETSAGSADFNHAGSLCHGWSALPALYYRLEH